MSKSKVRVSPSRRTASRSKSITWPAIVRWHDRLDMYGRDAGKMRGVDARLLTIAPAFEGVIGARLGLHADRRSAGQRREIVALAQRAIGTSSRDAVQWELERALVACDWMVRCALPLWIDRLPGAIAARQQMCADLRALRPTLWTQQLVEALSALSPHWIGLGEAHDRATAADRMAILPVHRHAETAMQTLALAITRTLRYAAHGDDKWIVYRTLSLAEDCPAVDATVPALLDVLFAVQPGDSRASLAARCKWPAPAKRAVA